MTSIRLSLNPVAEESALKDRIYEELKRAILEVDIYASDQEHRLDERQLATELGVATEAEVRARLAEIAAHEAEVIASAPDEPRLHN